MLQLKMLLVSLVLKLQNPILSDDIEKLDAMYTTTLSMRVVVQRDFSIYSPNRLDAWVDEVSTHCEGCFVWGPDADLPQG